MQVCALFLEAARHQIRVASLQKCHALPEPHTAHKILGHCNALLHDTLSIVQDVVLLLETTRHQIWVAVFIIPMHRENPELLMKAWVTAMLSCTAHGRFLDTCCSPV